MESRHVKVAKEEFNFYTSLQKKIFNQFLKMDRIEGRVIESQCGIAHYATSTGPRVMRIELVGYDSTFMFSEIIAKGYDTECVKPFNMVRLTGKMENLCNVSLKDSLCFIFQKIERI